MALSFAENGRVCVTGAGGFVASWLVNLLLSKDYTIHGTVRDPGSNKYAHLMKLENASEKLKLFKADLLDYDSLAAAIKGCDGVFHVACPVPSTSVPNPEVEVVEPTVKGTLNVLKACVEANVTRVVYVSSVAAVEMNPNWPKGQLKDESCWSDREHCKKTNNWYYYSKTEAESQALEFGKRNGIHVVSICPTGVCGPMLQGSVNTSSLIFVKLLREGLEKLENKLLMLVDVRDVAGALLLTYEKPEAEGRYICTSHSIKVKDFVEMLKKIYPTYNYPKRGS